MSEEQLDMAILADDLDDIITNEDEASRRLLIESLAAKGITEERVAEIINLGLNAKKVVGYDDNHQPKTDVDHSTVIKYLQVFNKLKSNLSAAEGTIEFNDKTKRVVNHILQTIELQEAKYPKLIETLELEKKELQIKINLLEKEVLRLGGGNVS